MFGLIRVLIGCVFFCCSVLALKRFKTINKHKKYIVCAVISIALTTALAFLPFENLFTAFKSPESVYKYVNYGKSNVKLVVDGNNSSFVIGEKNHSDTYLIVPKTSDGWKIGVGTDTKLVSQINSNGIVIHVYQYKNMDDYYVTVFDVNGGYAEITDSCNSSFQLIEQMSEVADKTIVTYYASVSDIDASYWISVNGNKILLGNHGIRNQSRNSSMIDG